MVIISQVILFAAAAPLLSGFIAKVKNNLRMRRGQGIFQPYYNLAKLFSKGEVVSENASWIFRAAPFVVLSTSLTAAILVPSFIFRSPAGRMGDFLALLFILALGRFFLALAALDTGSSFGGMGSSREMFISSLAEPAFCMAVFALSLRPGSTDISAFGAHPVTVSAALAGLTLFLVALAETSRIPVDNQETHLELTMIHEAMVLEYSGRPLALIEMAAYLKQLVFFFLIAQAVFPVSLPAGGAAAVFFWAVWYVFRIACVAFAVALVEVAVSKMRLFRAADYLGFALVLGIIASVCAILGA